jgi:hypothetical protein
MKIYINVKHNNFIFSNFLQSVITKLWTCEASEVGTTKLTHKLVS